MLSAAYDETDKPIYDHWNDLPDWIANSQEGCWATPQSSTEYYPPRPYRTISKLELKELHEAIQVYLKETDKLKTALQKLIE